jgi:hypothetical protein
LGVPLTTSVWCSSTTTLHWKKAWIQLIRSEQQQNPERQCNSTIQVVSNKPIDHIRIISEPNIVRYQSEISRPEAWLTQSTVADMSPELPWWNIRLGWYVSRTIPYLYHTSANQW